MSDTLRSIGEAMISLRGVTKAYRRGRDTVPVLKGVDLVVQRGEFVALMGPSGSGKTTLLNLMGGLDGPGAGELVVSGLHLERLSPSELSRWRAAHVGFVFQAYTLLESATAWRNVELPLLLTRLSARERARHVETALGLVGLQERARHRPLELSGGQQQRVAIARALVADAPLLLCDEPTGDLDRETGDQVLSLLQQLQREQGKTIVMVTHDPLAAAFADRTVRLDKGVIVSGAEPTAPATLRMAASRLVSAPRLAVGG
jgi:putative ABC transport system ATP-binding protein